MTLPSITGAEAEAYVERRMQFSMAELRPFPKYIHIETVSTCNARCIMCGIDFDSKPKRLMGDELFAKLAAEIGEHRDRVEKVMPYLDGEPLIDKKIPARIRLLKDAGVKLVNISSNTSLLDEEHAHALLEAGLDEIYMTIDSLKPEIYEAIRVRLKFDTVMANAQRFIALRDRLRPQLRVRVQMIRQELNKDEPEDFIRFWRAVLKPTDQIVIQKAHNWANAVGVMKFGDEDDVNAFPCQAPFGTMVVHVDGTVPLCCMDTTSRHPVGDLTRQSMADIWHGAAMERYRQLHLDGRRAEIDICDGCTLWREGKHQAEATPTGISP